MPDWGNLCADERDWRIDEQPRKRTLYHIINRADILVDNIPSCLSFRAIASSLLLLSDMSLRPWPGIFLRYSGTSIRPLTLASQRLASVELSRVGSSAKSPAPVSRLAGLSRHFSSSSSKMAPVTKQYDYIVIGGGSGGSGAARRASGWYGAKTCIIDAGVSGGCCVNVG
jgi:hypothetical protein